MDDLKQKKIIAESQNAYDESLQTIYNFFYTKADEIYTESEASPLYKAVFFLGKRKRIPIIPYHELLKATGEDYTIDDIARLSHFPCRRILLEDGWQKRNIESFITYIEEEDGTFYEIVCMRSEIRGYFYYDPLDGLIKKLTEEILEKIRPEGVVLYQPFPEEKMTMKKLVKYGYEQLSFVDKILFLGFSLIITLIGLTLPYLSEIIYDQYLDMKNISPLLYICMLILAFQISGCCFGIVRNLVMFRGVSKVKYAIQAATYDRLFRLPCSVMREYETVDLGMRAKSMGDLIDIYLSRFLPAGISLLFSVIYIFAMWGYSPVLTIYGLLAIAGASAVITVIVAKKAAYDKKYLEEEANVAGISLQLIKGMMKIKIAGAENKALLRYLKEYCQLKKYYEKTQRLSQLICILKLIFTSLFSLLFYYVTIAQKLELTLGELLGFFAAFGVISNAFFSLLDAFSGSSNLRVEISRLKPILENVPNAHTSKKIIRDLAGEIEINHVDFSYSKEEKKILDDLSFHVNPGEYVGIVGTSGCGKSTLMKILLGMEEPDNGGVYYDGTDIRSLNKTELRKKIGIVLQDGKVFAGSILENIVFTHPKADEESVKKVIREVGLEEDLRNMPMGVYTHLSEGGGCISGGQQQRILIARALIGNPKIILFDEATSALDNIVQNQVCENLGKRNVTRIVIAHRLSTIEKCNRIYVMDKGKFIESGSYEELMKKKGMFYLLSQKQMV